VAAVNGLLRPSPSQIGLLHIGVGGKLGEQFEDHFLYFTGYDVTVYIVPVGAGGDPQVFFYRRLPNMCRPSETRTFKQQAL
jgi:hypothetical protein